VEAEIDKLLEQGTAEMDVQKRRVPYTALQEIFTSIALIETFSPASLHRLSPPLTNFHPTVGRV